MNAVNPILARKLGLEPAATDDAENAPPASPMRMMRRAMARAADKSVGLSASVLGIAEDETEAETLIEEGPEGWVVLGLREGNHAGLCGLMLLDPALRSALVEMQTMGSLLPPAADPRPVTRIDAVMSVPFAQRLLSELTEVGFDAGGVALDGLDIGPVDDLRTAGLVMAQGRYRTWQISVQVGGGDVQGDVMIALLPKHHGQQSDQPDDGAAWRQALRNAVCDAPADLDAVLGTLRLPISKIEAFDVGQVVPLPGTTVGSVVLKAPGGEVVAAARLGQTAGKRAVRLEETRLELQEDRPKVAIMAQTAPAGEGAAEQQTAEAQ